MITPMQNSLAVSALGMGGMGDDLAKQLEEEKRKQMQQKSQMGNTDRMMNRVSMAADTLFGGGYGGV